MCIRSRPVSEPLSVSENSPTAAWPLRSSGTALRPSSRRSVDAKPADRFAVQHDRLGVASRASRRSARSEARSARCRRRRRRRKSRPRALPATHCRARRRTRSASAGSGDQPTSFGGPKERSAGLAISFRFAPIIISAIERDVSRFGSHGRRPCRRAGWSRCRRARRSRAACARCRGSSSRSRRACAGSRTIARPPAASAPRSARP